MAEVRRRGIISGGKNRIVWNVGPLVSGLNWFRGPINDAIQEYLEDFAAQVEEYMKVNAPWDDRTTNARSGLTAQPYERDTVLGILLSHGVDYGIWLEIRWGGRFAIIIPTLEVMGPAMMSGLEGAWEKPA